MMREILFRGKTLSGKWVEGFFLIRKERYKGDKTFMSEETIISSGICESSGAYAERTEVLEDEVIPETVGQFTGLTDKHGAKIFEGDIVLTDGIYGPEIALMAFYNGCFRPYSMNYGYMNVGQDKYLVIGNIHDNPELLKDVDDEE